MPYNPIFNGFQATAEEIPAGDPLVAPPANLGPYTPWSIHVTMAGARLTAARRHTLMGAVHAAPTCSVTRCSPVTCGWLNWQAGLDVKVNRRDAHYCVACKGRQHQPSPQGNRLVKT